MRKTHTPWRIKQYKKMYENGKIRFDHPLQRPEGQWSDYVRSNWIHSTASDFPIPAVYAQVLGEDGAYSYLDGKQRLTSTFAYIDGEYKLHPDTPTVKLDGVEYQIAGKYFEELDEEIRDEIQGFVITTYRIEEATDAEIELFFERLNSGSPLSAQQIAKAKMGIPWAIKINELMEHSFIEDKAHFSKKQYQNSEDETAVLQAMLMMDDTYDAPDISAKSVSIYTHSFPNDDGHKEALLGRLQEIFDYMDEAFDEQHKLIKKAYLPMLIQTADHAMKKEISPDIFGEWADEFWLALKGKSGIETNYKEFTGAGTIKNFKAQGRVEAMQRHLDEFALS